MLILGIAVVAAALMGVWHVTKYAAPRAARAVGAKRRASIDRWNTSHPGAPASARWAAWAARSVAAVRWGPKTLARETKQAWREGFDAGRHKYGVVKAEPQHDPTDPNNVRNCPVCKGQGVVNGQPCPQCLERQRQRNADWEAARSRCLWCGHKGSGYNPLRTDLANGETLCGNCHASVCKRCHKNRSADGGNICLACSGQAGERARQAPPEPARPRLASVPRTQHDNKKENPMAIQTSTGGEIVNAGQFLAESKAVEAEAAADMEDATADAARALEDFGRIERMVASLTRQQALAGDVAKVKALMDPATRRASAAKERQAAAEQRLAGAKAVTTVAARHAQMVGTAAGPFYAG